MKIDQRDADAALGANVHRHSSWSMPLTLLVVTAVIGAGIFIYLTGPTVQDLQGRTPSPTDSIDPVDVKVDGTSYRIPGNYTEFRATRSGGEQDEVALHVLLPDLRPWAARDAEEFASNAPDSRAIHIVLKEDHQKLTEATRFERALKPQTINPDGTPAPDGLTQFDFPQGLGYDDTQIFTATLADGSLLVLRCDKVGEALFGPSCIRSARTPDGVGLTYRFKRKHLSEWKAIDDGVTKLIASFRARAPK